MGLWMVLLGWIFFAGTHIGLSAEPVRSNLIGKMGEKGFQGIYSLIALLGFAILIAGYVISDASAEPVFDIASTASWMVHLSELIMFIAFILFFSGFITPSPTGMAPMEPEAKGIVRITRHPVNVAFALFGLSHVMTNRTPADWLFYLGFFLFGFLGSAHQDRKKIKQRGEKFNAFIETTSIIPFLAILSGKQKLKLSEISKIGILLAIIATVVARVLHPTIRDQIF